MGKKKKLKIITYDGKSLVLPADTLKKIIMFGETNIKLKKDEEKKISVLLIMPKELTNFHKKDFNLYKQKHQIKIGDK